jgi:hypothetical protein
MLLQLEVQRLCLRMLNSLLSNKDIGTDRSLKGDSMSQRNGYCVRARNARFEPNGQLEDKAVEPHTIVITI